MGLEAADRGTADRRCCGGRWWRQLSAWTGSLSTCLKKLFLPKKRESRHILYPRLAILYPWTAIANRTFLSFRALKNPCCRVQNRWAAIFEALKLGKVRSGMSYILKEIMKNKFIFGHFRPLLLLDSLKLTYVVALSSLSWSIQSSFFLFPSLFLFLSSGKSFFPNLGRFLSRMLRWKRCFRMLFP